jgi:hypothetical protein
MPTKEELLEKHDEITKKARETLTDKNDDYTGSADALANFKRYKHMGVCDKETGILSRIVDKVSRLSSLVDQERSVEDETFEDTVEDLINYSIILSVAYNEEESNERG